MSVVEERAERPAVASQRTAERQVGPSTYGVVATSIERESAFSPSVESGLDAADLKIIDILLRNGRANNRSMTERVGLTEETIASRIRSMIEREIIGITAILDWEAAGYQYDLWLRIDCDEDVEPVIASLQSLDQVVLVFVVLGGTDLIAHVLLPDRAAVFDFLARTLNDVPGIAHVDTLLGLDTVKFFFHFARIPILPRTIVPPDPILELTEVDRSIVDALIANGRASNREIARTVGISDGTVRTRLRRLEAAGLLKVCAQIHPANSGMISERAFVAISVRDRDAREVACELAAMPEVLTVSLVTGTHDILAYVVAPSRMRMAEIIAHRLRAIPGVRATKSYDIIGVAKSNGHWARW